MTTPNLGLSATTQVAGSAVKFLTWRLLQDNDTNSNMSKIDAFAGETSASVVALKIGSAFLTSAAGDGTDYTATVSGINTYAAGTIINLKLNINNTGTATLNINSLGVKSLYKVSSNGVAGNLSANDLIANRYNLFIYDAVGGYWIWVSAVAPDQITISGSPNELVILNGSGSGIINSGILASQIPSSSGSYIVMDLNSSLNNEWKLVSGSGTARRIDASASLVTMDAVGSVPIVVSGSAISHGTSGVSSGSYVLANITVDTMGHLTVASTGASIANTSSVNDGTSASALVSASSLADSNYGKKSVGIPLTTSASLSGNEINYVRIPSTMNGWILTDATASVSASSTSGSPTFGVYRVSASSPDSSAVSMLTENIYIKGVGYDSSTSGCTVVISSTGSSVLTGDKIKVTAITSASPASYAQVSLTFQNLP